MRTLTNFILGIVLISLFSCKGSDTYRGLWKATNLKGEKYEITFEEKEIFITYSTGQRLKYEYTQNSVSIKNSVETYGIKTSDGKSFKISFPIADDETKGVITDDAGNPVYLMGRADYVKYEDIYGLK
jgi:hypothetical protein